MPCVVTVDRVNGRMIPARECHHMIVTIVIDEHGNPHAVITPGERSRLAEEELEEARARVGEDQTELLED